MALREKLAELFVIITAKLDPLKGQMAKARGVLKRGFASMGRMARRAALFISAAIVGIGVAMVKMAMDAEESENLFEESMGNMSEATRKWSEELSKSLGLNAFEVRKFVSVFNVMLESMDIAPGLTAEMSKSLVKLAFDMASFYNLKPAEAFQKLQAAISGESEPLKRLGILINETTIKQWALNNGLISGTETLTEMQKVMARYGLIMARTTKAQGDLERTAGSATNLIRSLRSTIVSIGITLGKTLIPHLVKVVKSLKEWIDKNKELMETGFKEWIDALSGALKTMQPLFSFFAKHAKITTTLLALMAGTFILSGFAKLGKILWWAGGGMVKFAKGAIVAAAATKKIAKTSIVMAKWAAIAKAANWGPAVSLSFGKAATKATAFRVAIGKVLLKIGSLVPIFGKAVVAIKAFATASVAGFAAVGAIIGLVIANVVVYTKLLTLLWRIRKNNQAVTDKTIENYKKEHKEGLKLVKQKKDEIKAIKEQLKARLEFFKKVGGGEKELAAEKKRIAMEELASDKKARQLKKWAFDDEVIATAKATGLKEKEVRKALEAAEKFNKAHASFLEKRKKREEAASAAKIKAEEDSVIDTERLRVQRDFFKKVGGSPRRVRELDVALQGVEAKDIAKATGGDERQIRLALRAKTIEEEKKADRDALKERLRAQIDLFTNAKGFEKKLAQIKKTLRQEEAKDIQEKTGVDRDLAEALLAAKETPMTAAKIGLSSFESSWNAIAVGAKKVDEQQLATQKKIQDELRQIKEQGMNRSGMQNMGTQRF